MRIGFIGAGRAGSALATALAQAGHPVVAVADLRPERAAGLAAAVGAEAVPPARAVEAAEIVFLSVPDDAIAPVAAALAAERGVSSGKAFYHLSGLHPASLLLPLGPEEMLGSLHPLLPLADAERGAARLKGCLYAFEGGTKAREIARMLVRSLGGRFHVIAAEDKPLYHAAAVIASNYLVALFDVAFGLLAHLGLAGKEAREAVRPLAEATLANLLDLGPEGALTGPISRGDLGTVRTHLCRLAEHDENTAVLYRALGRVTLRLAERAGRLDETQIKALESVLGREGRDG